MLLKYMFTSSLWCHSSFYFVLKNLSGQVKWTFTFFVLLLFLLQKGYSKLFLFPKETERLSFNKWWFCWVLPPIPSSLATHLAFFEHPLVRRSQLRMLQRSKPYWTEEPWRVSLSWNISFSAKNTTPHTELWGEGFDGHFGMLWRVLVFLFGFAQLLLSDMIFKIVGREGCLPLLITFQKSSNRSIHRILVLSKAFM